MADGFTIDLTNYKDRVGARVPEGDYDVVVEDTEDDKSKAGNPMVNVWFRVIDGPEEGATIVDRLVLTEKSLFRVVGFLQALGIPTPKKKFKVPHKAIRGRRMTISVEDGDPWNGRVKSEVRAYNRYEGTADEDVEDLPVADEPEASAPAPAETEEASAPQVTDADDGGVEEIDLDEIDL